MSATLTHTGERFELWCSYDERGLAKDAKFRWDNDRNRWWTDDVKKASTLREYADVKADAFFKRTIDANFETSSATDAKINIPVPAGLAYMPFQKAGVAFAARNGNTLNADEPGLGKTIQAAGLINLDPAIRRVLVICPASLRLNWKRELERFLVNARPIYIVDGRDIDALPKTLDESCVIVINYDVLTAHHDSLVSINWDLLVCDEAHYLKNGKAQRTRCVVGHFDSRRAVWDVSPLKAKLKLMLTGTPIVNRPVELWTIIHYLDRRTFPNFMDYAHRYCNAQHNGYGWDFSGASNLDELQRKLRSTIMVRRLKSDVLTELPAKTHQVIEISHTVSRTKLKAEIDAYEQRKARIEALRDAVRKAKETGTAEEHAAAVRALRAGMGEVFTEMAQARHDNAVAKIPYVIEHLNELLENEKKVVVFAHHHEVVDALAKEFHGRCVKLDGRMSSADKQASVDAFQNDPNVLLFIGSITAAGVGITLTASSHVVFAELDWVPGNMTQAEDRTHRIGQRDNVLVQMLVLEGSLDAIMAHTLVDKQEVITAGLDADVAPTAEPKPTPPEPQAISKPQANADPQRTAPNGAPLIGVDDRKLIHDGLKTLAGMCDFARNLDGCGFNKLDAAFGHSLAEAPGLSIKQATYGLRLVIKYQRQLPRPWVARYYEIQKNVSKLAQTA